MIQQSFGRKKALSKMALGGVAGLALCTLVSLPAAAQTYPTRPVRILVPYSPGSAVDLVPRMLAEKLTAELGHAVVVENKTGGLGIPAISDVMNNPADGHTVLAADASHWAITPAMQTVPYDFMRDLAPVTLTYSAGLIIFTGAGSGINSMQDLVTQAKAKPGQLNYGTAALLLQLGIEVLKDSLGLDIKPIRYRGAGEVTESILRNDTQLAMAGLPAVLAQAKAGKLKLLAVTIPTRLKQLPDVPTVNELTGLKDYSFPGQQALVVKTGTPRSSIDKLGAAVRKVATVPEFAAKVTELSAADLTPTTPEQTADQLRGDIVKFTRAVKFSGIKS